MIFLNIIYIEQFKLLSLIFSKIDNNINKYLFFFMARKYLKNFKYSHLTLEGGSNHVKNDQFLIK